MQPLRTAGWLWPLLGCTLLPLAASGQASKSDFFREHVAPLLRDNCFKCHSHAADKIKGGLLLDSRAAVLEGGDTGPAIVPGNPDRSLLIQAIRYTNEDLQMPPKDKKLSAEQIATLTQWVQDGAEWPEDAAGPLKPRRRGGVITNEDRQWWAFQPVRRVSPPASTSPWPRNDIDRFILARLEAEGLTPAPSADKRALLRRVYFDLIGLPPTADEADAFVADSSPDAYARVVERLLASPRYGERWATLWLDLVRYAESDGYKADDYRPNAWRYRDYVIDAFNADKPYDRFVQEQLAGDELWPGDPAARVATGYLAHSIYEYNQRDAVGQRETILNDLTDTTADAFLGLGLQCARCHDHKFDPLLQKDYFRLQAFFAPLKHPTDVPVATTREQEEHARRLAAWEEKTADLRRQLAEIDAPFRQKAAQDAITKFPPETRAILDKRAAERTPYEQQIATLMWKQVEYEWEEKRFSSKVKEPAKSKRNALLRELKQFEHDKPEPLPAALAATDLGRAAPPVVIPKKPGLGEIAPGFPTILDEAPARIDAVSTATTGRRAALARWVTSPENPLTARVMANRIWQAHFGRGLAINPSDFGRLGEKPSHPELLDWLAHTFVQGGWRIKHLQRIIVTSATYMQSAAHPDMAAAMRKDPENRLLWRGSLRRLEAEQVRDAVLAATGELKLRGPGPADEPEVPVRSIYQKVRRNRHDPVLEVFDQPERFVSNAGRNVTTTSTQALLMLNDKWPQQRAAALAAEIRQEASGDEAAMVRAAYRRAFSRNPTPVETRRAREFLDAQASRISEAAAEEEIVPFASEKMRFRDGSAAVIAAGTPQERLVVPNAPAVPGGEFTIEAYITLKSPMPGEAIRTIVSQGGTAAGAPGWVFGVTGKRSHVPQTLVLKLSGDGDGADASETILSGLHIEPDTPYFVGVSVRLNDPSAQGITFFAKDLTDPDDPLRQVEVMHRLTRGGVASAPLVIGGTLADRDNLFDGLIDDVRLSAAPLGPEELLPSNSAVRVHTMGYWKFETKADPFSDSSNRGHAVRAITVKRPRPEARAVALADFCHVLLNTNEFIHLE